MPTSVRKALREARRGVTIARLGGFRAGWVFLREECLRNGWIRLRAGLSPARASAAVECNLCGWRGPSFLTHCAAAYVDRDSFCPRCHSYARHRGCAWLLENLLAGELAPFASPGRRRLVFAPESGLLGLLSTYVADLEGADLHPMNEHVVHLEDLQSLSFADESVDFVSCFHVLEHVPDDRRALAELHRVLHPTGRLLFCVPISFGRRETIDFGGPNELLNDHCFDYGEDFPERLLAAGFSGTSYRLMNVVPRALHGRMRMKDEQIFLLRRTPSGETARIDPWVGGDSVSRPASEA